MDNPIILGLRRRIVTLEALIDRVADEHDAHMEEVATLVDQLREVVKTEVLGRPPEEFLEELVALQQELGCSTSNAFDLWSSGFRASDRFDEHEYATEWLQLKLEHIPEEDGRGNLDGTRQSRQEGCLLHTES